MPGSIQFLRGVLGVIAVGSAFMAARAYVAARKGWGRQTAVTGWLIRTVLCLAGVIFRHGVDVLDIAVWVLMLAAVVGGWWITSRPHVEEDLTHTIFPDKE